MKRILERIFDIIIIVVVVVIFSYWLDTNKEFQIENLDEICNNFYAR